jgi:DNA-binding PadR family transcriptional regulator
MNDIADPSAKLPLTHLAYHVLLALADRPLHGYGIIQEVAERTDGQTRLEAGTLYAAIKRLKEDGLLEVADATSEPGPRQRRDYTLTNFGCAVLEKESERLANLVAIARFKRVLPADSSA